MIYKLHYLTYILKIDFWLQHLGTKWDKIGSRESRKELVIDDNSFGARQAIVKVLQSDGIRHISKVELTGFTNSFNL